MNLQQAKELKENDPIIFDATIYKFLKLVKEDGRYFVEIQNGNCHVEKWEMSDCQTIGDYRGSFDKEILPPEEIEDFSFEVFIIDETKRTYTGFYNYRLEEWRFNDNILRDFPVSDELNFKWCFIPSYLKF